MNKSNEAMRDDFYRLCVLLPDSVNWGDPITPEIIDAIAKAAQASIATSQPQTARDELLNLALQLEQNNISKVGASDWVKKIAALIEPTVATDRQESEARAVAKVTVGNADHGPFRFEETPYGFDILPDGETNLYTAPPSALAIETAAKLEAAEVCNKRAWLDTTAMKRAEAAECRQSILATIPQDGITALEELLFSAVRETNEETAKGYRTDNELRTIVTRLIGEKE